MKTLRAALLLTCVASLAPLGCTADSDSDDDVAGGGGAESADETSEDGTFDPGSGIGCLFGDHLVTMARLRDLKVGAEKVLTTKSKVPAIQRDQILDAFNRNSGEEPITDVKEAIEQTDDGEIAVREVEDTLHKRKFRLYVTHAGDNVIGFIYYAGSTRLAADIGDGSIECVDDNARFSAFDDLPFFYTN